MASDPNKTPPVQPIRVTESPFGDFSEEQMAGAPLSDKFYLKGYSDKRHERELAIKAGERAEPMPRRFQYVSVEKPGGAPDKTKYVEWLAKGYRAVQYDELESLGINPKESTVEKDAAGNARVASQILMVADARTAARNFRDIREKTENQMKDVAVTFEQAGEKYNQKLGHTSKSGTKTFFGDAEVIKPK